MRKEKFLEGEYYHIYNRGNSKQQIFHDYEDYDRFKKLLYLCNGNKSFVFRDYFTEQKKDAYDFNRGESLVNICSYVVMPNHFHIFLTPRHPVSGKSLGDFIRRVSVAYSKYYNTKYNRLGALFEGNFNAEHVTNDVYFKYLFSYIHLNPIKLIQKDWKEKGIKDAQKAKEFLSKYNNSSFLDYFNLNLMRKESKILDKESFFCKIDKKINLEKEIFNWLNFVKEQPRHPVSG